jgi:hypothetical protein
MAKPCMSSRRRSPGAIGKFGEKEPFATLRQPVRHEVVTHVFGTFRYRCLRSGQLKSLVGAQGLEPWTR